MWFYIFSVCFLVYVGTSAMEDEISATKAEISATKAEISALKGRTFSIHIVTGETRCAGCYALVRGGSSTFTIGQAAVVGTHQQLWGAQPSIGGALPQAGDQGVGR